MSRAKPESSISSSDGQRLEEPVAQHPELQAVEEGVHLLPVPRLHGQVVGTQRQVEVVDQRVELAVLHHLAEVLAQRLALLAGDLVGPGDDVVEAVVGVDPLRGVALADAGDAGQVVGGLPHQRGELGVAVGRHAVPLLDGGGRHPLHLRDAAHRVDHGGAVVDQLEGVAVAAADQHLEVAVHRLRGQRADDVVGLEAGLLDERHAQRLEHLLDQGDLAGELLGRLGAVGLVVGELLAAEGLPRDVEGDGEVGRLLVAQHVDEHRGEAVDGVGVLAGRGGEVLHRQRVERAVGQRVAVDAGAGADESRRRSRTRLRP